MNQEDSLGKFVPEKSSTLKMLDVQPKMILECAMGIEDPSVVAERYGYYGPQWEALKVFEPFVKAVEEKKVELYASGYTFRTRANILAHDLLEDIYLDAKAPDTNAHTRLEALKFLSKAGGIDQPAKEVENTGNAFSITINLGQGNSVKVGGNTHNTSNNDQKTVENSEYCVNLDDLGQYLASSETAKL